MKNLLVPVVILVAVVVLGAGFIILQNNGTANSNENTDTQTDTSNIEDVSASDDDSIETSQVAQESIIDLFESGENVMCTWSYDEEDSSGQGSVYIANGQMKQEFSDENSAGNVLYIDNTIYYWASASDEGFKFTAENLSSAEANLGKANYGSQLAAAAANLNLNQNYAFDCSPWIADASVLTPPSDVTFTDYDELMQSLQQYVQN